VLRASWHSARAAASSWRPSTTSRSASPGSTSESGARASARTRWSSRAREGSTSTDPVGSRVRTTSVAIAPLPGRGHCSGRAVARVHLGHLPDSGGASSSLLLAVPRPIRGGAMMGRSTRGVVTAVLTAVLAVSAMWHWPMIVVVALAVGVLAGGWPRLVGLPVIVGPGVVIALSGLASLAVVTLTGAVDGVTVVVGLAVAAAFVQEMLRRDGRPRLVESVAGTVTGAVVAASAGLWPALGDGRPATAAVVTAAAALAAGAACTALPMRGQLVAPIATLVAGGVGLLCGSLLPHVGPVVGAAT